MAPPSFGTVRSVPCKNMLSTNSTHSCSNPNLARSKSEGVPSGKAKSNRRNRQLTAHISNKSGSKFFKDATDIAPRCKRLEDVYDIAPGTLGSGRFGTVRKVVLKGSKTVVQAVKTVPKADHTAEQCARQEIPVLTRLDHPCICRLLKVFEDKGLIHIVLDCVGKRTVFHEILDRSAFDEVRAAGIMRQLFGALQHCHERNVIHRDVKPENIMVKDYIMAGGNGGKVPCVKLLDFGLAVMCDRNAPVMVSDSSLSPNHFAAPETKTGYFLPVSDTFSAGVVLHALLVGHLPTTRAINGEETLAKGEAWMRVSSSAKSLVNHLLQRDPSQRFNAKEGFSYRWTQGGMTVSLEPSKINRILVHFLSHRHTDKLLLAAYMSLAMQLPERQLLEYREAFMAIDIDGNGVISREELMNFINKAFPVYSEEMIRRAEHACDLMDQSSAKGIDYTTWLAAVIHDGTVWSDEATDAAFEWLDTDGNGLVDRVDLAKAFHQTPQGAIFEEHFHSEALREGAVTLQSFREFFFRSVAMREGQEAEPKGRNDAHSASAGRVRKVLSL